MWLQGKSVCFFSYNNYVVVYWFVTKKQPRPVSFFGAGFWTHETHTIFLHYGIDVWWNFENRIVFGMANLLAQVKQGVQSALPFCSADCFFSAFFVVESDEVSNHGLFFLLWRSYVKGQKFVTNLVTTCTCFLSTFLQVFCGEKKKNCALNCNL